MFRDVVVALTALIPQHYSGMVFIILRDQVTHLFPSSYCKGTDYSQERCRGMNCTRISASSRYAVHYSKSPSGSFVPFTSWNIRLMAVLAYKTTKFSVGSEK